MFHLSTGDAPVLHGHLAGEAAEEVEGVEDDGEDAADEEEVDGAVAGVEEPLIESFPLIAPITATQTLVTSSIIHC